MTRDEAKSRVKSDIYQYADFSDNPNEDEFWQALDMLLEQEPSGDAISRRAVLKLFATHDGKYLFEAIRDLPSVTPKQRTGHWIYTDYHTWCCSECGGNPHRGTGFTPNKDGMKMQWKYCNLCGAKMESEEQA